MAPSVENNLHAVDEADENFVYAVQLSFGTALPMALHTAIELGVFDIIANAGPESKISASNIVAKMPDVQNPDAAVMLDRILRLLASYNIVGCSLIGFEGLYSLTPVSKYFVPNKDGVSLAPYMAFIQDKVLLDCWTKLKDSILEGGSPFEKAHGVHCYDKPSMDQRFNNVFNRAMFNRSTMVIAKLLETYKGFEQLNQLVDVGGSVGHTLKAITSKYPNIKGINFDLPHVVQNAPAIPGVEHIGGSMFESIPKGEAIFIKSALIDWDDESCIKVLKNCYDALPDDGKVILMDDIVPVMPECTTVTQTMFLTDLGRMILFGNGKGRTEHELAVLAKAAGFRSSKFACRVYNYHVLEFLK